MSVLTAGRRPLRPVRRMSVMSPIAPRPPGRDSRKRSALIPATSRVLLVPSGAHHPLTADSRGRSPARPRAQSYEHGDEGDGRDGDADCQRAQECTHEGIPGYRLAWPARVVPLSSRLTHAAAWSRAGETVPSTGGRPQRRRACRRRETGDPAFREDVERAPMTLSGFSSKRALPSEKPVARPHVAQVRGAVDRSDELRQGVRVQAVIRGAVTSSTIQHPC